MQIKLQLEELEERTTPSVVAVDDSTFATYGSQSVTSNVLMNDAGYPLTASVVTAPSHGTLSLNSDGSYTYTHTDLSFSGYDVAIYRASDGSSYDDGALTIQVMDAMSSTSIVPSSYSVLEGESITFTATVSDTMSLSGSPTPSGSVVFKEGSTTLATVSLNSSGVATYSISSLSVDMHTITAEYVGSMPYSSSSGSTIVTVSKATTMTSLSASPSSIHQGESVTLTATVTSDGAGTPTGTVVFKEGSTTLGSSTVDGSGIATFSTSDWPTTGLLLITAEFTGMGWFDNSSGDTILMVSANSAPTLDTISNQSHAEGATGTFPTASATDPESQTINYSANNLPTGLSINASTGVISGTIGYSAYYNAPAHDGVYASSVTATDIYGLGDTKWFSWMLAKAAYTVTDLGDGGVGAGLGGDLRYCITQANGNPGEDTIEFLQALNGTITLNSQLPEITGVLTIVGPGANNITIHRNTDPETAQFRLMTISAICTISGLTFSNGNVTNDGGAISNASNLGIGDCIFLSNTAIGGGGAIYNAVDGSLTVSGSNFCL